MNNFKAEKTISDTDIVHLLPGKKQGFLHVYLYCYSGTMVPPSKKRESELIRMFSFCDYSNTCIGSFLTVVVNMAFMIVMHVSSRPNLCYHVTQSCIILVCQEVHLVCLWAQFNQQRNSDSIVYFWKNKIILKAVSPIVH